MSKISLFANTKSVIPESQITIDEFLSSVKFGKWRLQIEAIRNEPDKDKRKALKELLPAITASGIFSKRNQDSLLQHSGFICIDLDNFTDKTSLLLDQYTHALFTSVSGGGLAVLVKINPAKHKESFKWLQEYYFKNYGIVCDPAPSNPASLRFVSWDPECFVNEKSKPAKFAIPRQKKIQSLPIYFSDDHVGQMVKEAVSRGINIAESYSEYLTLAFAISSGFGEAGRSHFHALAGVSSKYNSEHADKQYNICLKKPDGGITVGSFYYLLKQAGINFPDNKKYEEAIRTTAIGKRSSRTESDAVTILTTSHHLPEADAKRIAKEVYSRPDITLTSIAADPEKLIHSLVAWMQSNYPIKKNLITGKLEDSKGELTKERFNTIYLHARAAFNTPNITFDLIERVLFSEFTESYNPIKDYIESNRHRNTVGNIDRLINTITSKTPGHSLFIRKWLLAIPAAIEGKPVRLVLALTGQGLSGKTEWFRRLLPKNLKKYFGESKLMAGKDDELLMCEKLIILDDELGGKSKHDASYFKMISSKDWFSLRAPFGRGNMDYKRLAILCGTSNEREIINDPTGNTRILPVEVLTIDHEAYNSIDKDELFMEIVRTYESGEDWNFTKDEVQVLAETSKEFEGIKIEQELILRYFLPEAELDGSGGVLDEMTAMEIKSYIEIRSMQKVFNMKNFGSELKSIFGNSKPKKVGGKTLWQYSVVKLAENSSLANPVPQSLPRYEKADEVDF